MIAKDISNQELLNELASRIESKPGLAEEHQALKKELILLNKKLEESESLKSHFISNITNEIINPFASVLGLSKAILSVDKENWKKVLSMVSLIYTEAFALDFQLKNIFSAAKIEAGEIYPETGTVDILNVTQSVMDTFKIEARKKKVKLEIVVEESVSKSQQNGSFLFKTDPEKFKLILLNLINNAIKYSFEDGTITIRLWKVENLLYVSVKDRGTGISDEHQSLIFDRFKRIDSGITSTNRGHGLGLSINKALLDLLGGDIKIDSVLGEGSTFTIHFPEAVDDSLLMATDDNELFFDTDDHEVF